MGGAGCRAACFPFRRRHVLGIRAALARLVMDGWMKGIGMYFASISPIHPAIHHGCLHLRPGESYRASSCRTTVACRPWRMRQPCIHGLHMRAMAPGLPHDRILCVPGALDRDYLLRLGVEPKPESGGPWRWERRARCRPGRSACLREYWPNIVVDKYLIPSTTYLHTSSILAGVSSAQLNTFPAGS